MLIITSGQEAKQGYLFSIFFNMKVHCMCSLESLHRGYPESAAMGFFQGTQERVRNRRGKGAISFRATEVLLYVDKKMLKQA